MRGQALLANLDSPRGQISIAREAPAAVAVLETEALRAGRVPHLGDTPGVIEEDERGLHSQTHGDPGLQLSLVGKRVLPLPEDLPLVLRQQALGGGSAADLRRLAGVEVRGAGLEDLDAAGQRRAVVRGRRMVAQVAQRRQGSRLNCSNGLERGRINFELLDHFGRDAETKLLVCRCQAAFLKHSIFCARGCCQSSIRSITKPTLSASIDISS
jgi:hypothetical protein